MSGNHTKKNVLITGATKGLGLAIALQFAREGYQPIITYAWGSVPEEEVLEEFSKNGLPLPLLIQADVINEEDTANLFENIKEKLGKIDVFISGVSFSNVIRGLEDYSEKALLKSIEYSSWPMVEYTRQMKQVLGSYPKYVIGLSSRGPDNFQTNYDFAAITKALMETMVKYLNYHFYDQGVIFNVVRTRAFRTDNVLSTFGAEWCDFIEKFDAPHTQVSMEEMAKTVFMLCSGLMDGIRGQTIMVDKGYAFADTLQRLYVNRGTLGLTPAESE